MTDIPPERALVLTERLGFNPRHVPEEKLTVALHCCEVGSLRHRALLHEARRRREERQRRLRESDT